MATDWKRSVFIETPILWPREAKSQLIGKDTDAGTEGGGYEGKRMTEDDRSAGNKSSYFLS